MLKHLVPALALIVAACQSAPAVPATPGEAGGETTAWRPVDPENLILMELPTGRVAIELFPEAAPGHVAQMRKLVRDGFYDNQFFYRVIEGHVAQAGREFEQEIAGWPTLAFEAERAVPADGFTPHGNADLFAPEPGHRSGFAVGRDGDQEWLLNCPGTLGMARGEEADSGSTEIFIPLQPRRYLDRNYTIFGRVIAGMDHVHRLPRVDPFTEEETEALFGDDEPLAYQMMQYRRSTLGGNYITAARMAADVPEAERPAYEVMNTASAEWDALKTSKRDYSGIAAFIAPPVNMLDICALPAPAREVAGQ